MREPDISPRVLEAANTTGPSLTSTCLLPVPSPPHCSPNTRLLCAALPRTPCPPNFFLFPKTQLKSPSTIWSFQAHQVAVSASVSPAQMPLLELLPRWAVIYASSQLPLFLGHKLLGTGSQPSQRSVPSTTLYPKEIGARIIQSTHLFIGDFL